MQRVIMALIIISFMLGCSHVLAETVGVVNLNKVNAAMHLKNIIKARVAEATRSQNQSLVDMNLKINTQEINFRKKTSLTNDQKKVMANDIAAQRQKFFNLQRDLQIRSGILYQKTSDEMKSKFEQILGTIAAKHQINLVFTEIGLAYAAKKIDLTDELITELTKIYRSEKGSQDD